MHTNSKLLFEKYVRNYFKTGMRILEIGPDNFPSTYGKLINIEGLQWDTLDIYDSPNLTYSNSDIYSFAIPDESYDLVLSGQVIEHVAKIWRWMPEVARVTKKGGVVITVNPVSWPYHEVPIDCWRIYPDGMRALCEDAGLSVELSVCESLEEPETDRFLPGRSSEHQPAKVRKAFKFLHYFGFPIEKSFDTITIARK